MLKEYIYNYAKYLGLDYENLIDEFNEYMFEYTSKIPTDVIERISKQKEKEEEEKGAVSPYTIPSKKNNKKLMLTIAIVLLLIIAITTIVIVKNNNSHTSELALSVLM